MNERITIIVIWKVTTISIYDTFSLRLKMLRATIEGAAISYTYDLQKQHLQYLDELKKRFLNIYTDPPIIGKKFDDYDTMQTLVKGGYSTVFLVRDKYTLEVSAMKVIEKEHIMRKNHVKQALHEKKILQSLSFPFTTTLTAFFMDNVYLYFVTPFESGGELYSLIRKCKTLSETLVKFYAGQVVLGLEYLHHCSVVHRDVKPENIFISREGYIKLGDYGFSKVIKFRTWTLCGTPEYVAPEIILSKGYTHAVDWWAMGVLIFEMSCGYSPFYSSDIEKQYEKIVRGIYKIPDEVSVACKSLLKHLLVVDPSKRYGSLKSGIYDIKTCKWFSDIDWIALFQKKIPPPYVPAPHDLGDSVHFAECEEVRLKKISVCLYPDEFSGF